MAANNTPCMFIKGYNALLTVYLFIIFLIKPICCILEMAYQAIGPLGVRPVSVSKDNVSNKTTISPLILMPG